METVSSEPGAANDENVFETDYIIEHPEFPDLSIPKNIYYPEYLLAKLKQNDDEMIAMINAAKGNTLSYGDLRANILAFAFGLQEELKLNPLDCVLLMLPNGPEFIAVQHGTLAACGRISPMSCLNGPHEIHHCLSMSNARVMVIANDKLSAVTKVINESMETGRKEGLLSLIVVNADKNPDKRQKAAQNDEKSDIKIENVNLISFEKVIETGKSFLESKFQNDFKAAADFCVERLKKFVNVQKDWVALYYSSGTTGLPKGVMHSHSTLLAASFISNAGVEIEPGERIQAILPFSHMFGNLMFVMGSVAQGGILVYRRTFDKDKFFSDMADFKIRTTFAVPPLILLFTQDDECLKHDLSSIKRIYCSAAPLSAGTEKVAYEKLSDVRLLQLYGLSECGCQLVCPISTGQKRSHSKMGTTGCVFPGVRAKVVDVHDPTKTIRKPGERGNLAVKSPSAMLGYLNNDEATGELIPFADGWIHTGDVAYFDEDHYFFIVDRIKELIKYKGHQIAPAELEAVLLAQPGVADAAVIGVPAEGEDGQYPFAFVVTNDDGSNVNVSELAESVSQRVAAYKKLRARHITLVDHIPKSPSGKILRRELRQKYCDDHRGDQKDSTSRVK